MVYIFAGMIFLLGTALGSFVAVVSDRYNTGLPFWGGRSICFSCGVPLKNLDLVPVFSFLFLKGHCRYCEAKIPAGVFLTELLMGALSVLVAFKSGILMGNFQFSIFNLQTVSNFLIFDFIFANILLISIYDLRHFIIPDAFLLSLAGLTLIFHFVSGFSVFFVLAGIVLALPFCLMFLISRGSWFGFGDVKYILVLGFFLGLVQGLSALVLAFWIGAAFALAALLLKKIASKTHLLSFKNNLTMKSEIPFGPFLSVGTIISFYLNADLFQIHRLFF